MSSIRPSPFVDQRRIELDQAGAGADFCQRRAAAINAADADQRERALGADIGLRHHPRLQPKQRPARQVALLRGAVLLAQGRGPRQRLYISRHHQGAMDLRTGISAVGGGTRT